MVGCLTASVLLVSLGSVTWVGWVNVNMEVLVRSHIIISAVWWLRWLWSLLCRDRSIKCIRPPWCLQSPSTIKLFWKKFFGGTLQSPFHRNSTLWFTVSSLPVTILCLKPCTRVDPGIATVGEFLVLQYHAAANLAGALSWAVSLCCMSQTLMATGRTTTSDYTNHPHNPQGSPYYSVSQCPWESYQVLCLCEWSFCCGRIQFYLSSRGREEGGREDGGREEDKGGRRRREEEGVRRRAGGGRREGVRDELSTYGKTGWFDQIKLLPQVTQEMPV